MPHHISGDGDYEFEIVGESNYQHELESICGGKTREGHEKYCKALLIPEPDNPYDKHAVAVYIRDRKVGHIPKEIARRMGAAMKGQPVSVDAVIVGGWVRSRDSEGHFGVKLDL